MVGRQLFSMVGTYGGTIPIISRTGFVLLMVGIVQRCYMGGEEEGGGHGRGWEGEHLMEE